MKAFIAAAAAAAVFVAAAPAYAMADTARAACLINSVTGETVYEKNADAKLPMASTTKIMTLILALENSDRDDTVIISENAAAQEGSSAYLTPGAAMTMRDLEYGLMLNSGNDAAVAIAEHISGDTDAFSELMTERARELGLCDTSFKNPNGLNADGHHTTAGELAELTAYAMKNAEFREIVSAKTYTVHETERDGSVRAIEYINHNRMLGTYEGCIGVKTGYTEAAGRCLVSAARRGSAEYVAVTLGSGNDWAEHKQMLDCGFETAREVTAVEEGECFRHIVSDEGSCEIVAADSVTFSVNGDRGADITVTAEISDDIAAPLNKGEKVGCLRVEANGREIGTVDAVASSDLGIGNGYRIKPCFFTTLKRILGNIFG